MPRFQFRLQQYLGVKEQIENQKELEYAHALRKVEVEKQKKEAMVTYRSESIEALRTALTRLISPLEIKRYNHTIDRLTQQINLQEMKIVEAEALAEDKRQALVQAMKDRKALEIVRDNTREEFNLEVSLAEQKQVDELVSFKYTDKIKA